MAESFVLDAATWRVQDLSASLAFYQRLGFRVLRVDAQRAELVPAGDARPAAPPVLRLEADPVASVAPGRGAYHLAFLLPTRRVLAAAVRRLAHDEAPLAGFADHLVSEAVYLQDTDGHGLEFSWDLPRGTVLGHVHLFVADVAADARWYRDALGLAEVVGFGPWGTFLAADGYHHHVGLRRGVGVTDPDRDQGLVEVSARLAAERYAALAAAEVEGAKTVAAPSGHRWRLRPLTA